ncbi:hypothetical protein COT50_02175 [candidate division WWE3 bacterium CG08_land_8_20_14_0_20_41_10]|uniref:Uncharacterized protein n=1 Tax=candidate division WWE3 bacterium CG08_land_8_20_14_0_20_41_10 TaxID=1975085 RepID=A0A2H0XC47_UNCKA|nr:MAG: hypothetical protein COT50_02175 [candidate division WWE3 bacterium CG08_land_8_20_14_0_20_41_10]
MTISDFEKKVIAKKVSKVLDVRIKQSHHTIYNFYHNGKFILRTYHSHRTGDLRDFEVQCMKSQLKLDNKQQLLDLNNCPLSAEGYLEILSRKGLVL